jgi:integrase
LQRRLQRVQASTLNRELDILRHAFATARRSWDVALVHNVFAEVKRPGNAPRERRLQSGERERLQVACVECRNPYIRYLVELALETAMRRGELLSAHWAHVSFEMHTLHIPVTKNGYARTIPLSGTALALLRSLQDHCGASSERLLLSPTTRQRWRGSDW